MQRGDAVVTGFSGTKQPDPPLAGDPIDETFIDLDGPSAQIFKLEPGAPPSAQVISAPPVFQVKARDVGQVFAIALDGSPLPDATGNPPNIYLGATWAFGLQIVIPGADGQVERVKTGHPNAEWMAGQFGLEKGGGPGSIWKVDGKTGAVSRFATIPGNSGPGLGDIVFDPATRQLFVSDLDTGLIHRLDSSGALRDTFDHGQTGRTAAGLAAVADDGAKADIKNPIFDSQNPATWGFTQLERRVWGLGLRAGRLYYAVAEGPAIWSVSINLDGTFGADPRREIEVSGTPNNNPISDIAFDSADYMYVAQRGGIKGSYDYSVFADPKQSVVFRFKREIPDDPATPGIWVPIPDEYAIGFPPDYRNTSGGLALGYGYDQSGAIRPGACDATIWSTGDALRDNAEYAAQLADGGPAIVNGLQGNDRFLIRPDNEPPFKTYFVDYDGKFDDAQKQGHVGDVEIWQPCDRDAGFGGYQPWWSYPSIPPVGAPSDTPPGETPGAPPSDIPGGPPPTETWPPAPPGWPPVPPPTPGSFNLRVDKAAAPGECVAGGIGRICTYAIRVTNTGPGPYFGDITVTDRLPAAPAGAVMTFSPPWACVMIAPTEHQCTHPLVALLPGDSVDLFVQVELPADYRECFLDNLVRIDWPAGFGDANPGDDAAFASASIPSEHCVRPPDGPPPERSNLRVQKSADPPSCRRSFADLLHYYCLYLIQVTNTGPGVYNDSIELHDQLSAVPAAISHSPEWTCEWLGGVNIDCTHPPVLLNPGESVFLWIWATVPVDFRECHLENQVHITHAPGGSDQNTEIGDDDAAAAAAVPSPHCVGERTNLLIEKKAEAPCSLTPPDAGIDAWQCRYYVRVTNMGPGVYSGPLEIEDQVPPLPAGSVLSLSEPGGGCHVYGDPPQTCSLPSVTLAPGDWVQIHVSVLVVRPYDGCELTNTARIAVPPGGSPQNTDGSDDESSATALIDSPSCNAARTNLRIRKTASSESCGVQLTVGEPSPEWVCRYFVRVINEGPGTYRGPIEVEDQLPPVPAGSSVTLVDPGGVTCALGPPPQTCSLPDVTLGPGGWIVFEVTAYIRPPAEAAILTCELTNTARITVPPGGSPQNTDGADDESSATLSFDRLEADVVHCGPPPERIERSNLQIRKTVISSPCLTASLLGHGLAWACEYAIQVRNTGPGVYYGSIEIEDLLPELPAGSRVHIRAPDPGCAYSRPALPSQSCTLPGVTLGPGGWQAILVTVIVPQSYDACDLTNTARITWAPGGSPQNSDRGDDESSATAPINSPRCIGSRSEPIVPGPPEPAACPQGWSQTPVPGKCCPPRTSWDGKRCKRGVEPPKEECPKGYVGTPPNCKQLAVPPKECPKGTTGKYPDCKPIVSECKKDEKLVNGKCVRVPGPVVCGPDSVLNRRTGQCEPLAPPPPTTCPKGQVGTPPDCKQVVVPPKECPKGYVGTPPNCKQVVVPPKRCPKGTTGKYPDCKPISCPKGTTGKYPDCKPIVVPPKECPKGFVGTPPNCKPIVVPLKKCPKGFVGVPPYCKPIVVPPKECPKGSVGTPPNCKKIEQKCPTGTTGIYPNCKPVSSQDIKKLW